MDQGQFASFLLQMPIIASKALRVRKGSIESFIDHKQHQEERGSVGGQTAE